MENVYFRWLCFMWAFVGITTRILMVVLGDTWNKWELDHAYTKEKPRWINVIGGVAFAIVIYTWYQVFSSNVAYSWIIAVFTSLTLIKISALLFNYDTFRQFAYKTLSDPLKRKKLNISVFFMSIVFILLGLYLY